MIEEYEGSGFDIEPASEGRLVFVYTTYTPFVTFTCIFSICFV